MDDRRHEYNMDDMEGESMRYATRERERERTKTQQVNIQGMQTWTHWGFCSCGNVCECVSEGMHQVFHSTVNVTLSLCCDTICFVL